MITVQILINGEAIFVRSARNIREVTDGVYEYKIDTGDTVQHVRAKGAIPLVKKMLNTVKEL